MDSEKPVLVIFGATGDLTAKKLLPALNHWYEEDDPYDAVWCLGRRGLDTVRYLQYIEEKGDLEIIDSLKTRIVYHSLDFNDTEAYADLFRSAQEPQMIPQRRTYYLAVKPDTFTTIADNLYTSGLFEKGNPEHQLIFEKPFGESLQSAKEIQAQILNVAEEFQIYRIDHYLGKEMIRNILAIRFGNRIFEESWNGRALSEIRILSTEDTGVDERMDYYDRAGAINDMVQSHLLQVVALIAMEPPCTMEAESIRQKKIDVLEKIRLFDPLDIETGQYAGYTDHLKPGTVSSTETYVKAAFSVDHPRWSNTRFVVETGKRLKEKRTEIILSFSQKPMCLTEGNFLAVEPNTLIIQVYPKEGVHLRFNSKTPGYDFTMAPVDAEYCHSCRVVGNKPEAYVKLLRDAMSNDRTLFASCEELNLQWEIADRIREAAADNALKIY